MNVLPRDKQIEIIAALSEGMGIRATARLTGANRETVGKLALQIGAGCAELHDRAMVGIRVDRLELDELWSFVGKKRYKTVQLSERVLEERRQKSEFLRQLCDDLKAKGKNPGAGC